VRVFDSAEAMCLAAADEICVVARDIPDALLLTATGHTPMPAYAELARRHAAGELDTSRLRVAQLDEYLGLPAGDRRSLEGWTRSAVLEPLAIDDARFIPLRASNGDAERASATYDAVVAAAGGIELAVLGLGPNGHLGFNEPPSDVDAPTRRVALTEASVASNARYWGSREAVPREALTAGMRVIMAARRVLLLVSGARKRDILAHLLASRPTATLPASWLHQHPRATLLADQAALP